MSDASPEFTLLNQHGTPIYDNMFGRILQQFKYDSNFVIELKICNDVVVNITNEVKDIHYFKFILLCYYKTKNNHIDVI